MTHERKITGTHVLIGFVTAFGIIIAVNFTLAYNAVATFPGLEVKNTYVASQEFDEKRDDLREDDLLEILLHLCCFFRCQVLEEFTDGDFDALLA